MFVSNPFTLLTSYLPARFMQCYVVLMVVAVIVGTLFDLYHKRSARFFARRRRQSKDAALRRLGSGEVALLALRTIGTEIATSGEFCKWPRRLSHLLMSYGFVIYVVTTFLMALFYASAPQTPILLTALWNIGALMVLLGGSWFFFLLRVNVAHEGHSPFHLMRADLFIGSLLASVACGLAWHFVQTQHWSSTAIAAWFALYLGFSTLLFASVPWSKFAHMFYKPMAALQKRIEEANGSSDLPRPAELGGIAR
jgi:hypothetical protein